MSMHLAPAYLTTTRYNAKKKLSAKEQRAKAEHEAWLKKQGLHPEQLAARKAPKSDKSYKPAPIARKDDSIPLSNTILDGGRARGIMANLHKETPEVQKAIMDKAKRTAPAYSKGAYQYITSKEVLTDIGRKK